MEVVLFSQRFVSPNRNTSCHNPAHGHMNNTRVLSGLGVLNMNSGNPRLWLLNIFSNCCNLEVNFSLVNFIKEYGVWKLGGQLNFNLSIR